MMGENQAAEGAGVVPRVAGHIFQYIREQGGDDNFLVQASFVEVYSKDGQRDEVLDLLRDRKADEDDENLHANRDFQPKKRGKQPMVTPRTGDESLRVRE